jgi:hypothetical protein
VTSPKCELWNSLQLRYNASNSNGIFRFWVNEASSLKGILWPGRRLFPDQYI